MAELWIDEIPYGLDPKHEDKLVRAFFISQKYVASLAKDITIVNFKNGLIKQVIPGRHNMHAIASTRNGFLIGGYDSGVIELWGKGGKAVKAIPNGRAPIISLKVTEDLYLAAVSKDNTIKIWVIHDILTRKTPLHTMTGHGIQDFAPLVDLLSNGFIVTCSTIESHENVTAPNSTTRLKIWDPKEGKLVKMIKTQLLHVTDVCVLRNQEVALCTSRGELKIINLCDASLTRSLLEKDESRGFSALKRLPNGFLLAVDSFVQPIMQVWNPETGRIVQKITMKGGLDRINSCDVSKCGEYLLTGSEESNKLKIWFMKIDS